MANDHSTTVNREGTLPAPHQHITLSVERWPTSVRVQYIGRPTELTAAGLVTPRMLEKILSKKSGARTDELGRQFKVFGGRRSQAETWLRGEPVKLIYRTPFDGHTLALPGVRELYPDGIPEWEAPKETPRARKFRELSEQLTETASRYGIGDGGYTARTRPVGRFRRVVDWATIGMLIVPNWRQIRLEATQS